MSKKYSFELKKEVVEAYLAGEGSYPGLAAKYGISAISNIQRWIWQYKHFGEKALRRKSSKAEYDLQFKLNAIQCYLTTETTYEKLAEKLDMDNPDLITYWVNKFHKEGIDGFSEKKKGTSEEMSDKNTLRTPEEKAADEKRIKELEQKVLYLEIENAYLKELRRLRLQEQRKMKGPRGLSAVSEDHTD